MIQESQVTAFQLHYSTDQIEASYFTGAESAPAPRTTQLLPEGVYRVIAGELFRLADGVPPSIVSAEKEA